MGKGDVLSELDRFSARERVRRWDFGTYKLHPLWTHPDPDLRIRPSDKLYRGTTSRFLTPAALVTHSDPREKRVPRIYMSEGVEDAAGYAPIEVKASGGAPLLCEVTLDEDLFRALKPGLEGLGEWYVEMAGIPQKNVRCRRLTREELVELPVKF